MVVNLSIPTPSPTKKVHMSSVFNDGTNVKSKFGLVEQLFGKQYADNPTESLDRLIMQCVELKQTRTGNSTVLTNNSYKMANRTIALKYQLPHHRKGLTVRAAGYTRHLRSTGRMTQPSRVQRELQRSFESTTAKLFVKR